MSEPNRDLEQLDLTERVPPFDRELGVVAPTDGGAKPRVTPPPIPAGARTSRSMRAASVPPSIPDASRTDASRTSRPMRAASVPPPIPQRALTQSSKIVAAKPDDSVDVDLTSFAPSSGPESEPKENDAASLDVAPRGSSAVAVAPRQAAVIDVPSVVEPLSDWSVGAKADDIELLADDEAPAVAPPLPTFMLTAARTSLPTPTPLARDARRGTLPPPVRSSTSSFAAASPVRGSTSSLPVAPPPIPTAVIPTTAIPTAPAMLSAPPPIPTAVIPTTAIPTAPAMLSAAPPIPARPTPQAAPAQPAFPVVIAATTSARHEDPTPLPRPHVEHDDEVWFDSASSVSRDDDEMPWDDALSTVSRDEAEVVQWDSASSTVSRDAEAWDSTSSLHRKVAAPIPVFKLGIAAVLVGGLSAMTVILLRGDHEAPAHRTHHAAIAQAETPAPTPTPAVIVMPVATPEPAPAAVAATTPEPAPVAVPAMTPAQPDSVAAQPAPAAVIPPTPAPEVAQDPARSPEPAVAVAPAVATEPAPPAASPNAHHIPFSTEPEGATVTLIVDGAASIVGQTPLSVNLDPAHTYDIVVTLAGYRTRLARIDPKADEVNVVLVSDAEPAPATHEKASRPEKREIATAPAKRETESAPAKREPTKREARQTRVAAETRDAAATPKGGSGILMVSSKPPCEIAIDGVATMQTTPQRAIKLKPGKHKVTLFNDARKINKTFEVAILPGQPTKLIRDFMGQ